MAEGSGAGAGTGAGDSEAMGRVVLWGEGRQHTEGFSLQGAALLIAKCLEF